jgi:hypothetical protein
MAPALLIYACFAGIVAAIVTLENSGRPLKAPEQPQRDDRFRDEVVQLLSLIGDDD